ncbi:hypothetical protein SAMN05421636_101291 [Pricia antarctica]|uniref:Uncharacterized protein n=1 Tax=Pricia antarctica TaxID=641691 RepID=A0A1G6WGK2_9FLAO|nr:hypothetical protein [Pricia antarctica]SDD64367.1 hypothetical protein SAMN05421636_101291 [Pricia antarctica]
MLSKFQHIRLLIFLIVILGIPYTLRLIDYRLEPFPSIILPFGSNKTALGDEVRLPSNEIYGYTMDGQLKKLEKSRFLQNIRVGYFDYLYEDRFGLRDFNGHSFRTTRLGIPVKLKSKISETDIQATKIWIRQRLLEQGCTDSVLILKKDLIVIPRNGTYYEETTLMNDTILDLY